MRAPITVVLLAAMLLSPWRLAAVLAATPERCCESSCPCCGDACGCCVQQAPQAPAETQPSPATAGDPRPSDDLAPLRQPMRCAHEPSAESFGLTRVSPGPPRSDPGRRVLLRTGHLLH